MACWDVAVEVRLDGLHQPRDLGGIVMHLGRLLDERGHIGGRDRVSIRSGTGPFGVHTLEIGMRVDWESAAQAEGQAVALVCLALDRAGISRARVVHPTIVTGSAGAVD